MIDIDTLPSSAVNEPVYRVILSRYPQIHLFERVSSPQDWDVLYAVESLTNPRLRDEVGDIRLVPPEDRVYGDGASWIMDVVRRYLNYTMPINPDFSVVVNDVKCTADDILATHIPFSEKIENIGDLSVFT